MRLALLPVVITKVSDARQNVNIFKRSLGAEIDGKTLTPPKNSISGIKAEPVDKLPHKPAKKSKRTRQKQPKPSNLKSDFKKMNTDSLNVIVVTVILKVKV